jgi:hypothetical protein
MESNTYQIRKIYAIGQCLGMVGHDHKDALHDLVRSVTGKESISELTYAEKCRLIGELEARQGTPPRRPARAAKKRNARPAGASEGQQRKVWALMYKLQDASPSTAALGDRLCGIIRRETHLTAFAKDPFAWMDYKTCNRLVETLKGYVKTAGAKNAGRKAADV